MALKRGQIGVEYLIVFGFITFAVVAIVAVSLSYASNINDGLAMLQVENSAKKIVSSSESVFYAGVPSRNTISVYFPKEVSSIEIIENSLVFTVETGTGTIVTAFKSNVPISGTLPSSGGYKKILLVAEETGVEINDIE